MGCGLSRHSVAFGALGAFLARQLQCSAHCKASSSVPQKSMIRNKNNRFQLKLELGSPPISGFNCWDL